MIEGKGKLTVNKRLQSLPPAGKLRGGTENQETYNESVPPFDQILVINELLSYYNGLPRLSNGSGSSQIASTFELPSRKFVPGSAGLIAKMS